MKRAIVLLGVMTMLLPAVARAQLTQMRQTIFGMD